MTIRQPVLVTVSLLCLIGCSEVSKPISTPPPPAPEATPAEAAPPPPPLIPAPKALASLSFLSGGDPRCAGNAAPSEVKMQQIEAEPLKVGLIPVTMPRALVNQMTEKTRVWKIASPGFDFYKILANGRPGGLRPDRPSTACIRYAMSEDGASLAAEMIVSVSYNLQVPEVISIAPARIRYRDFPTLSAHSGSRQAAVKAALSLKTYSLERASGRQSASLQNEEMSVEIVTDPGTGGAIELLYDPATVPGSKIPLPPWDYSAASENPRHNLSILELTVTEIGDFDWLQSQVYTLWPAWEYEATDVGKLTHSAEFFRPAHLEKT
jgi:hypothetical protein